MKIAITSTDGRLVNSHFGKATRFHIYEVDKTGNKSFLEVRETVPYCSPDKHTGYDKDRFNAIYELIKDCEMLLTVTIGPRPSKELRERGMDVINYSGAIKNIFNKGLH